MATTAAVLEILVNAKTGKASAELTKLDRNLHKVNQTSRDTDRSMGMLGARSRSTGNAVNSANRNFRFLANTMQLLKFPALIAGAGGAAQALSALGAGAVGLTGALGPLTGALVALPAAFGAAGQGAATALLAFSGLGDALGAMSDQQAKAGQTAADTGQQQRAAAEAVRAAEQALAGSQRSVKVAQEDLTAARQDAARQLVDMRLAAEGAALGEKRAALGLAEARQRLFEVRADPASTELDLRDALLSVQEAELGVANATAENKRSHKDLQKAQQEGIRGSDQVVSARRALADANRSVIDSARQLKTAQLDAATAMASGGAAADLVAQKMAKLSPAARSFAKFLFSLKPQLDKLRQTAGQNLFPGLEKGLRSAMQNFPIVNRIIGMTAKVMGNTAEKAGKLFGSKAFGSDLAKVGRGNARLLGDMGDASLHLASAMRHIMVAAQPLIKWMGRLAVGWSKNIEGAAKTGRETGRLAHFFRQTRAVMERLFSITGHLAGAFMEIGKAAAPLGRSILAALDKASAGLEKWTKSISGQNQLAKYFHDARAPIFEAGRLIGDFTKMFFRIGTSPGLTNLIRQFRTELLPVLETLIQTTTQSLGPALVRLGVELGKLLSSFAGSGGALTAFVDTLTGMAKAFNAMPAPLKSVVAQVVVLGGVIKALSFAAGISGLKRMVGLFRTLGVIAPAAATQAAGAEVAMGGAAAAGGGAAAAAGGWQAWGKTGGAVAGGAAAGGFTGKFKNALGKVNWKRLGAIGIGVGIASGALSALSAPKFKGKSFVEGVPGGTALEGLLGIKGVEESQALNAQLALAAIHGKRASDALGHYVRNTGDLAKVQRDVIPELVRTGRVTEEQGRALEEAARSEQRFMRVTEGVRQKIRELRVGFHDNLGSILKDTQATMQRVSEVFGTKSEQGRKLLAENYRAAVAAIKRSMRQGFISTQKGNAAITALLKQQLQSFGVTGDSLQKTLSHHKDAAAGLPIFGGLQRGGPISLGKASGDSVPAMLEKGEYVLNRKAVAAVGKRALDAVNFSAAPRFAKGGSADKQWHFTGSTPVAVGEAAGLNKVSEAAHAFMFRHRPKGGIAGVGSGTPLMKDISRRKGWNFADWWALDAAETAHGTNLSNPTSSARLRGQFLDMNYGKYGPGSDPAQNPSMRQQIISMARYIAERYKNPTAAWAWHQAHNWYQRGGVVRKLQSGGFISSPMEDSLSKAKTDHLDNLGWGYHPGGKRGPGWYKPHGDAFDSGRMGGSSTSAATGVTGQGPRTLGKLISVANTVNRKHFPYVLGGGHEQPANLEPFDCSGAVSYLLQQSGFPIATNVAAGFKSAFSAGAGKDFTIYASDPHVFVGIGDKQWGTSHANPGGGAGWFSGNSTAGFTARHPELAQATATASAAPKLTKKEKRLAAHKKRIDAIKKAAENATKLDAGPYQARIDKQMGLASQFEEYAGYASNIGTDDAMGSFKGQTEETWLTKQLNHLITVRNTLVALYQMWKAVREKLARELENRKKLIDKLQAKLRKAAPKEKVGLRERILGEQKSNAAGRVTLADLVTKIGIDSPDGEGVLGTLAGIQGSQMPKAFMTTVGLGQLGGQILDVQLALRELGAKTTGTDAVRADLLAQLLKEANQRTAVSQAQYPLGDWAREIFKEALPYGGSFAAGGVVPGAIGQPMMIEAHGGETVAPVGAEPVVNVTFTGGAEFLRQFIKVEVQKQGKRDARGVGRTPGSAGSLSG